MRKTLLTVVGLTAGILGHAQGTIYFSNRVPAAGLYAPVFGFDGVTRLAGPDFVAQLWAGPAGTDWRRFVAIGAPVALGTTIGDAGYYGTSLDPVRVIPFAPTGTQIWVQPRVWNVNDGATLPEVLSQHPDALVALPTAFWVTTGDMVSPGLLIGLGYHYWSPASALVPEPSVWLLLGSGIGGFLWTVRKGAAGLTFQPRHKYPPLPALDR